MNITVQQGEIQKQAGEAVVVNLFQGVRPGGATKAVDAALGGLISEVVKSGDFEGKVNQTLLLYTQKKIRSRRVLLVGLGPQKELDLEIVRKVAGTAAKTLQDLGVEQASTILHGTGAGNLDVEEVAQAVAEASILACYRFDQYRSKRTESSSSTLKKLSLIEFNQRKLTAARRGARTGRAIAEATCLARDLANHPGNTVTPSYLARTARRVARQQGLRCRVIDEAGMAKLGMGGLLGVSRGSAEAARFIVLEHNLKPGKRPLVLVGKGITFDSGGISIKSSTNMEDMKFDMCGAAAVIGAMQAIASLKVPQYVVGLVAASENLLDGKSYKPGDILKTMSGKTIEIINTDAEGRLILADALTYATRYNPAAVVDLATLTGACVIALGHQASGLMGNNEQLAKKVKRAGEQTGERVWSLPMYPEYREQIKSDVADMKNTGGRAAGTITAATLLGEFTESYPWAHIDIAGTAWSSKSRPYIPRGGVGVGVRLLTQLARDWNRRS